MCNTLNLSSLKRGNSPEEGDILPDSRLSERTSHKRETQCFKFGNSRSFAQARKWSLEREKPGKAVRFSPRREGPGTLEGFGGGNGTLEIEGDGGRCGSFAEQRSLRNLRFKRRPIIAIVRATYHRLNSWFLHHRNEETTMIRACHIYCEKLTKVIIENNHKATCQLVRTFSQESGVTEVEVAGRDGSRHPRIYTIRLIQNWCDCGEFQSLTLPYSHAIATCASFNLDCGQFISRVYRLDNLLKVYRHEFQPIGNEEYWSPYSGPTFIPNPLMRRSRTGRQKTTRIHNETNDSPLKQIKKCGW
ncbi:hypothetical protein Lal_00031938 [Lupinus albus]|nr:hypothetical protein Lal_00031938 [Lupinus albus]